MLLQPLQERDEYRFVSEIAVPVGTNHSDAGGACGQIDTTPPNPVS
jgi:hypothetical protein